MSSRPYKAYATLPPLPVRPTGGFFSPGTAGGFWESLIGSPTSASGVVKPSTGERLTQTLAGDVKGRPIDEAMRGFLRYLDSIPQLNALGKEISELATRSRQELFGEKDVDRVFSGVPAFIYAALTGKSIAQIEAERKAAGVGSRFPTKSGTSGNCNWDTKGGWCWNGIACGGNCKICRTGYVTSNTSTGCNAARNYFLDNYRKCKSCASQSGATVTPKTTTGCPYSGCTDLSAGSTCFHCRCAKLCSGKGGIRTVKSDGSCYCNGASSSNIPTTTAKPVDKLTSGCSYSGCNSSTGMTRCYCRCQKLCASKGGVKTVTSNGSCYCKGVPKPTSGGCSDSLKTRCGFFCASRPGNPYLDSKCSCFCR